MNTRSQRVAAVISAFFLVGTASSRPWWVAAPATTQHDFLPPDVAFRVGAHADGSHLHVRFIIADGYYLYRNKFEVAPESPDLRLGTPSYPPGTVKSDPFFGNQVVYTQQVDLVLPYTRSDGGAHPLQIRVTYQGCATAGLCYPPMVQVLFPDNPAVAPPVASHPWEAVAILGGIAAFFAAGWSFRRAKRPAMPV